jgi:hypothetical protein
MPWEPRWEPPCTDHALDRASLIDAAAARFVALQSANAFGRNPEFIAGIEV